MWRKVRPLQGRALMRPKPRPVNHGNCIADLADIAKFTDVCAKTGALAAVTLTLGLQPKP
jgi:hypothetical protein